MSRVPLHLIVLAGVLATLTACAPAGAPADPSAAAPQCGPGAVEVGDGADALQGALDAAMPGDVLQLAPTTYTGRFHIGVSGEAERPIVLCGVAGSAIDGGDIQEGYALHLDGASYWQVRDLDVRGAQKGVVLDATSFAVLSGVRISGTGQEGLHLRTGSSDNVVRDVAVSETGRAEPQYGEGVYVGSAQSNWCRYTSCDPDRSDRNVFERLEIGATTAEALDVKEGTTGGVVRASSLSVGPDAVVDSAVDLKGTGWVVEDSTIAGPQDAVSVHVILPPWGSGNRISTSTLRTGGTGVGVDLVGAARDAGNVVTCDNTASEGVSVADVPCR